MVVCGMMEKVWDELKKIEGEAEKIRSDAQKRSQEITDLAQKNSEKLVVNGNTYAREEGQQLYAGAVEEANHKRDEKLKASRAATEKLKMQAETRMELAVEAIVDAIVGEAKP